MTPEQRQAAHLQALQSARDSLSFILGEVGDAREAITANATPAEADQLTHVRESLDAVSAVTRLAIALIQPIMTQCAQQLDLEALVDDGGDPLEVPGQEP